MVEIIYILFEMYVLSTFLVLLSCIPLDFPINIKNQKSKIKNQKSKASNANNNFHHRNKLQQETSMKNYTILAPLAFNEGLEE